MESVDSTCRSACMLELEVILVIQLKVLCVV